MSMAPVCARAVPGRGKWVSSLETLESCGFMWGPELGFWSRERVSSVPRACGRCPPTKCPAGRAGGLGLPVRGVGVCRGTDR